MKTRNAVLSGLAASLLVPMHLQAATPSHQCAQLWDDVLRLSCYDTAFGKPRPPAEAAAPQASVAPAVAPAAPAISAAPGAAVSAAVVAPTAAAAVATPSAVTPVPAAPAAASAAPSVDAANDKKGANVAAKVTAVGQMLDGRLRVTLDNGQVWQQTEVESVNRVRAGDQLPYQLFQVKVGDQITLKSGVLGSRQMVAVDGKTSRVTLVK